MSATADLASKRTGNRRSIISCCVRTRTPAHWLPTLPEVGQVCSPCQTSSWSPRHPAGRCFVTPASWRCLASNRDRNRLNRPGRVGVSVGSATGCAGSPPTGSGHLPAPRPRQMEAACTTCARSRDCCTADRWPEPAPPRGNRLDLSLYRDPLFMTMQASGVESHWSVQHRQLKWPLRSEVGQAIPLI